MRSNCSGPGQTRRDFCLAMSEDSDVRGCVCRGPIAGVGAATLAADEMRARWQAVSGLASPHVRCRRASCSAQGRNAVLEYCAPLGRRRLDYGRYILARGSDFVMAAGFNRRPWASSPSCCPPMRIKHGRPHTLTMVGLGQEPVCHGVFAAHGTASASAAAAHYVPDACCAWHGSTKYSQPQGLEKSGCSERCPLWSAGCATSSGPQRRSTRP
jgi:hypothetical protein